MTERTVSVPCADDEAEDYYGYPDGFPVKWERQVSVPWCMTCDEPITLMRSEHVVTDDCDIRDGVVWKVVTDD